MRSRKWWSVILLSSGLIMGWGCELPVPDDMPDDSMDIEDDGPVAEGISGRLGDPMPSATAEQLATFERGRAAMQRRFDLGDGLGPAFNTVFCGGCHEKPVPGGSSGLYRNFFLAGRTTPGGTFLFSDSAGDAGGVQRVFSYAADEPARPEIPEDATIFAQRNAIPMFGAGLLAEISGDEILSRADPDDADGDGISGRANFDRGLVGRFGRKSQTVTLEGFVRGPLFNHLGITTVPLTTQQRGLLPVDLANAARGRRPQTHSEVRRGPHQAAAGDAPNFDFDGVPDPEMSSGELFDLVSFVMLLAAPQLEPLNEQTGRGRAAFQESGCATCHVPRLEGPRGPVPVYSDLLVHDMGEDLADGVVMLQASGSEFRTQPLWGVSATGPYLHDGRARTLEQAILAHGGEAQAARDAYERLDLDQRRDLHAFLLSLGGSDQVTTGLLPPDAAVPEVGTYGGPFRVLSDEEQTRFVRGREVFDRDFGFDQGAGALAGSDGGARFNGDSCRACHFDPVIGGAGPRGVNVMRHGTVDQQGSFIGPPDTPNTILHKEIELGYPLAKADPQVNVFEQRQTPHTFGLGLIESIAEQTILDGADPDDGDGDGISGRAHVLADGRVGRLGWKADVPGIGEFVRDAMAAEIGLTLAAQDGLTFGLTEDADHAEDPELGQQEAEDLAFFISMLAAPPRQTPADDTQVAGGSLLFDTVGCARCHVPSLPGSEGEVPLYSDLLLHEVLAAEASGVVSGDAGQREFRTAPLWGLSQTAPYWHTGEADTIDDAIRLHDGEASGVREAYLNLEPSDQQALLAFLDTL